jgi:hypothetical protein
MRYDLIYSAQAQKDLALVPAELLDPFEAMMLRLARHPVALSRRSVFPYPAGFQLFQFDLFDFAGDRHVYTILFRYHVSEQALKVAMIGHGQYTDPPEDTPV